MQRYAIFSTTTTTKNLSFLFVFFQQKHSVMEMIVVEIKNLIFYVP